MDATELTEGSVGQPDCPEGVQGAATDLVEGASVEDEQALDERLEYLRSLRARVADLKERTERQRSLLRGVRLPVTSDEVHQLRVQLSGLREQVASRTTELQRLRRRCADVSNLAASVSRVIETRAVLLEAQRSLAEVAERTHAALLLGDQGLSSPQTAEDRLRQQNIDLTALIEQDRVRRLVELVPIEVLPAELPDTCCCICQDELLAGDSTSRLLCQHIFHSQCIQAWLVRRAACPLCARPLSDDRAALELERQNSSAAQIEDDSASESRPTTLVDAGVGTDESDWQADSVPRTS
mmetsp:Transcript_20029/g.46808  ORF Transcript_20029/g.46808 Transcript_20029/m.46808 type:complete len:297 (+) Transcript_20029:26-916(+)